MYRVTEYLGDYQVEGQVFWGEEFKDVLAALFVADAVYREYVGDGENADYYVLVETVREDGLGDAVVAYTLEGTLRGDELEKFLAKFE